MDGTLVSSREQLFTPNRPPPDSVITDVASLYAEYQRSDIYAHRNIEGGVHFSRSADWFHKQMALPGARLLTSLSREGEVLSFALFFTEPRSFPPFADDCVKFLAIPGLERAAYLYLILTRGSSSNRGLGTETYQRALSVCRELGCPGIFHEYYAAPVPNHASIRLLERLARRGHRFSYLGKTAQHVRAGEDGATETITYQQVFVPAAEDTYLHATRDSFQLHAGNVLHPALPRMTLSRNS